MKKTLLSLGAIATAGAPIAAVVSCGGESKMTHAMGVKLNTSTKGDVWFVSDLGSVNDKSFNESGLSGVAKFGNDNKVPYNYIESKGLSGGIGQAYTTAVQTGGAKVVVGAGFAHGTGFDKSKNPVISAAEDYFKDGKHGLFMGVDAAFLKLANQAEANNFTSIQYNSQYAGYLAGLYAIDYIEKNQTNFVADQQGNYHVGTYGGIPFASVNNWIKGFELAVEKHGAAKKVLMAYGSTGAKDEQSKPNEPNVDKQTQYSGGFDMSGASFDTAKTITTELLKAGADIIFPVAGPQIKATMDKINELGSKAKVIGVDGDQKTVYGSNQNYSKLIIGSALKKLDVDIAKQLTEWNNDPAKYAGRGQVLVGTDGFIDDKGDDWFGQNNSMADIPALYEADLEAGNKDVFKVEAHPII